MSTSITSDNESGEADTVDVDAAVIEYLNKKGYNRTEATLRAESGDLDSTGRPNVERVEDYGNDKYRRAFLLLRGWIDNTLEIYKGELKRVLWPIFVYSLLDLIKDLSQDDATTFIKAFKEMFRAEFESDVQKLERLYLPEHIQSSNLAQLYLKNKYRIVLSEQAYYHLIAFLEDKSVEGGSVIIRLLHDHCSIATGRTAADPHSLAAILNRSRLEENMPHEEEGIPGHIPGSSKGGAIGQSGKPKVKLGPLPMEAELAEDVRAELEEIDAAKPPKPGRLTLVEEFEQRIKREQSEDGPTRSEIPYPESRARDVQLEVNAIREYRSRFKIQGRSGGVGMGVSVCMFTFHNTYDSVCSMDFSDDNFLVAIGTSESYIRVFSLDGKPLPSLMKEKTKPSSSRRLIGHSGPVYAVSFSPSISVDNQERDLESTSFTTPSPRYLVSSSFDRTVRLWTLDTWSCVVAYKAHMGPVWDVTWGPHGHYFLSGGNDNVAYLWSTDNIAPLRMFVGHDNCVDCVAFHPNSAYVFTASCDKTVRMWEVTTGNAVRLFNGHTGNPTALCCSRDGAILASADDEGAIILWDIASGNRIKVMRGHGKGGIWSLAWSAESTVVLSGGMDGTVRVWDVFVPKGQEANQGRVAAEGGAGTKIDAGGKTGQGAGVTVPAGTEGSAGPSKKKKKGKENVVTADQIAAFPTKKSPVSKVRFTRGNLAVAGGTFRP
ncbi:MAG: hypothetical protein M1825_001238 [Sarcosagium campestre]|nr:MAG: hypothetical protein M1825_001238 [Sarcosagium campestre]